MKIYNKPVLLILRPVYGAAVSPIRAAFFSVRQRSNADCTADERKKLAAKLSRVADDARLLSDIAKSFGLTRTCLKYWFPEECEAILDRHNANRKLRAVENTLKDRKAVVKTVRMLNARGEYPSRRQVNLALREHKLLLARADMVQVYRMAKRDASE